MKEQHDRELAKLEEQLEEQYELMNQMADEALEDAKERTADAKACTAPRTAAIVAVEMEGALAAYRRKYSMHDEEQRANAIARKGEQPELAETTTFKAVPKSFKAVPNSWLKQAPRSWDETEQTAASVAGQVEDLTAVQCRQAGYSIQECKQAGCTAEECKQAGYSAKECKQAGYTAEGCRHAGYSIEECKQTGYTASAPGGKNSPPARSITGLNIRSRLRGFKDKIGPCLQEIRHASNDGANTTKSTSMAVNSKLGAIQ